MDSLQHAQLVRASSALNAALSSTAPHVIKAKATAFVEAAAILMRARQDDHALSMLKGSQNTDVARAFAETIDDLWGGPEAQELAASYLASIAEGSLLDQIARYAVRLDLQQRSGIVASGLVANMATEGAPRVVQNLDLSKLLTGEPVMSVAMVVMTTELMRFGGGPGRTLFEAELRKAVTRAMNASVLTTLNTTSAPVVTGTGDPLADLRAGLQAAPPSEGYVVAAGTAYATDLATRVENRGGMGIRGGTFVPGVEIVAVDSITGLRIIPASHCALLDAGLRVTASGEASVDMSDSPTSPSQHVSLYQTSSLGLMAQREFLLASTEDAVIVTAGS